VESLDVNLKVLGVHHLDVALKYVCTYTYMHTYMYASNNYKQTTVLYGVAGCES